MLKIWAIIKDIPDISVKNSVILFIFSIFLFFFNQFFLHNIFLRILSIIIFLLTGIKLLVVAINIIAKKLRFRSYVLSLKGEKLKIIKDMLKNNSGTGYYKSTNVNILELENRHVIKNTRYINRIKPVIMGEVHPEIPTYLYVLTPEAKKILEKNKANK